MHDRAHVLPLITLASMVVGGCATNHASGPADQETVSASAVAEPASISLDEQYLIGPTAARQVGYRIEFQTQVYPDGDSGIRQVSVQGDSVFVLDGQNFLSRLLRNNGTVLWRIPVAAPIDEINGITFLPSLDRVLLTVGGDVYVLDDDTGSILDKQDLGQIASTRPIVYGPFLIYGSRNGQVVWHSYEVGHTWRGYTVAPHMRLSPILVGDYIVTIGSNGRVMVLDASAAAGLWDKQLLNRVDAEPTTGHGLVFIAGLDQYLWAIEIATGRTNWKYLTDTPLRQSPVNIDDKVFQQIPNEGLLCFEARPNDAPGGVVSWVAPEVKGNVVGRERHRLFVWDDTNRRLTILDADRGGVVTAVDLPHIRHLFMIDKVDGDLFAAGDDGRVIRLVPRA